MPEGTHGHLAAIEQAVETGPQQQPGGDLVRASGVDVQPKVGGRDRAAKGALPCLAMDQTEWACFEADQPASGREVGQTDDEASVLNGELVPGQVP